MFCCLIKDRAVVYLWKWGESGEAIGHPATTRVAGSEQLERSRSAHALHSCVLRGEEKSIVKKAPLEEPQVPDPAGIPVRASRRLKAAAALTIEQTPSTVPIPPPSPLPQGLAADVIASGLPVHPEDRVKLFSPGDWERFVHEWTDSLRDEYLLVERCSGAGDMGRDVVATVRDGEGAWDNYQCKHYDHALMPSDIWVELGKLAYYTKSGAYSYPRRYYFIAPKGAGTKLSNLLKKPEDLRSELFKQWNTHCREGITEKEVVECSGEMEAHIKGLDFSIFQATPVLRIIDAHAKTRWFAGRFGGGLPLRPAPLTPPALPASSETIFVGELWRAYADHVKRDVNEIDQILAASDDLREHFVDARVEFYSAESLRTFSRDTLPPGEFEKLQDELHSGIKDDLRGEHADGYRRVVAVVRTARMLQLTSHALSMRIHNRDRGGICHQLANDGKVRWVK